ncbi:MAG: flagellar export chaperone FliS [Armatimonadia bacterium]
MMGASYPARAYQTTAAETADCKHAVVLLYDAAVRFLCGARAAMQAHDYENQCENILRAQKIVSTLMGALDRGVNPGFADNLWGLYNWVHANLTQAGIKDDMALLEQIIEIMTNLREAWREAEAACRAEEGGDGAKAA